MSQSVNTIRLLKKSLQMSIKPDSFCIDATAGKGNDTLFLAETVGENGHVIAMDIQQQAIDATGILLEKHKLSGRVQLVVDSHINIGNYAEENSVDAIMFNLGYLPGGDHQIATKGDTTIEALGEALKLLKPLGMISLAIYHGGDTGFEERDTVLNWLKQLDSQKYTVIVCDFYNRPNHPPIGVMIIKEACNN